MRSHQSQLHKAPIQRRLADFMSFRRFFLILACTFMMLGTVAAEASTFYVGSSESYKTIQAAINVASSGDTISVDPGTYSATGDFNLSLGAKSLTITSSGGSAQTIINLSGGTDTSQKQFVAFESGNTGSILQGFTIEDGYSDNGGGVLVEDCTVTIKQCAFLFNTAPSEGGGIAVLANNAAAGATISQCSFSGNSTGVANSVTGFGGAIECFTFSGKADTVQIVNCVFNANTATYDGGAIDSEGVDATSPKVAVINCSFANNNASGYVDSNFAGILPTPDSTHKPGTVDCYLGTDTLTNSVLYGDSSPTEDSTLNPGFTASYTDIGQAGFAGSNHDFNSNPAYVSPASGNLEESAGSPLIGMGEATGTSVTPTGSVPTVDIDGLTRHSTPDIGAFEVLAPTANAQSVSVSFNTAKAITLTGTDNNIPARSLTYTVAASPTHGTLSGTAPNLTYTPSAGYHGSDSFTFTVNNGTYTSSAATVTLNVAVGTPTANAQAVNVAFNTAKAITLTGTDPDIPALSLTYTIATNPSHGTLSGFNAATGSVTYTPSAGYDGSDSFTFKVSNGTNLSSPATVTLTIAAGTPTANAQAVNVAFNTAKAITLTGTDPDVPALSLTYAVVTNPTHGTLSGFNASTGSITYTPSAGYQGADSFTFTVSNGTNTSSPATVTLNVAAGTPTANGQSVSTSENTAVGITLTGTDSDVPALSLTYAVTSNPSHGTLSGTAPNLTYTPSAGYFGSDSFQFTVSNGTNTSAPATVSITVSQAIGAPTANSQAVDTDESTAVAITLTGSDPNTPPLSLTYSVATNPMHGTLSGTAPNLTYTPNTGYFGSDSFTFTVNNGTLTSSPATVTINVDQVPTHLSVTAPSTAVVGQPVSVTVQVLDAGNSVVSGYSDYCNLTSSDPRAILPANFSLSNGTGTTSVTFNTAGNQTLNASSNALSGSTTVAVNSASSGTPKLAISGVSLSRSGPNVTVQFTLTNSGSGEADNVHLTLAKLAGISASSLPSGITLGGGQTTTVSVTFPGAPAGTQTLQLVGGYTAASNGTTGSFTSTTRVTVP